MEFYFAEALLLVGLCHIALSRIRRRERPQLYFAALAFTIAAVILCGSQILSFAGEVAGQALAPKFSVLAIGSVIPVMVRYAISLFMKFPGKRRWIRIGDGLAIAFTTLALVIPNSLFALSTIFLPGMILAMAVAVYSRYRFMKRRMLIGRATWLAATLPLILVIAFLYLAPFPVSSPLLHALLLAGLGLFLLLHSIFLIKRFVDHTVAVERNRLRQKRSNIKYRRFFPRSFLNHLGKDNIDQVSLGDHVLKRMSVMFVDIRNFTALSERLTPLENFRFVNGYLGRMGPAIRSHGGVVDKYIGDAILALFPGPTCDEALKAAIEIQGLVKVYNSHRHNSGYPPIRVGIGIHSGDLMLGIVGESERLQGTVISDAVNLASRLEGLNKTYGSSIIISNEILISLENLEDYSFRILDRVRVKGKEKEVSVIEILDGEPEDQKAKKKETRDLFELGLIHFHLLEYDQAMDCFRGVLQKNPHDVAADLYVQRCLYYIGLMALSNQ